MDSTLDELGIKFGTDKSSVHHGYLNTYEKILGHLKLKEFNFFEIGWGGYTYPDRGGNSARMWAEYFPSANILCLEKYKKDPVPDDSGIILFEGEEDDEKYVSDIMNTYKSLVVLNDGSHINSKLIKNFEICFPLMPSGGIYICEDVHSSYWSELAADGTDFGGGSHENTTINYFKHLCDANLNREDCKGRIPFRGIASEEFDIESITFYKKMIIIQKQ